MYLGSAGLSWVPIPAQGAAGTVLTKDTAEWFPLSWQPGGGGGGAPVNATYIVLSVDATLTDERVLTGEAGVIVLTDGGAGGNLTLSLDTNGVALNKIVQIATDSFLGRDTAGVGNVEVLTGTQATSFLDTFTSILKGLVPPSGGGTVNYLRADGTFAAPPGAGTAWGTITGTLSAQTDLQTALDTKQVDLQFQDEGIDVGTLGGVDTVNFTGTGVTASEAAGVLTVSVAGSGASLLAEWSFNTSVAAADPGNKRFSMNNATIASVTALYFNDTTEAGLDISGLMGFLIAGHRVYIQQENDGSRLALFQLTGAPTDNTGWWTVPVTVVNSGTIYQSNATCASLFLLSTAGGVTDGDKGDITVTGSGTVWTIDPQVVTYAKIQNISATSRFLGRITGGAGSTEELTGTQATTLLDAFTTALKGLVPPSGGGTTNFLRADGTFALPPGVTDLSYTAATRVLASSTGADATLPLMSSGDAGLVPASGGGTANFLRADGSFAAPPGTGAPVGASYVTIALDGTLTSERVLAAEATVLSLTDGGAGGNATIGVATNGITFAKFQQIATDSFLGRDTAGPGNVEVLSATVATSLLNVFTDVLKGLVPASGGGTANFLRADGTFAVPPGSGGISDGDKGDITVSVGGTVWTIDAQAVTYAKIQDISATSRFLGRITGGAGSTEELTGTQATTLLDVFTSGLKGLVPASGGGTTTFLRADGSFATPPGGGGSGISLGLAIMTSNGMNMV